MARRPLLADQAKVEALMTSIQEIGLQEPVGHVNVLYHMP
jgi:hypothetical protein